MNFYILDFTMEVATYMYFNCVKCFRVEREHTYMYMYMYTGNSACVTNVNTLLNSITLYLYETLSVLCSLGTCTLYMYVAIK